MINSVKTGVTLFIFVALSVSAYLVYTKIQEADEAKAESSALKIKHKKEVFEVNQTVTFEKEKEIKDEDINSTIGTHIISYDYWLQ